MLSTRKKNRRSNVDFPQLIALNVGDFILGCKFAAEQACPLNGGLKLERIAFLTGRGTKLNGLVFDQPLKAIRIPAGRR